MNAPEAQSNDTADTPGAAEANPGSVDTAQLEAQLDAARRETDEWREKYVRAAADFQNTRKRLENDAEQRLLYANQSLIKALLPVIDNFERALAQDPSKVDSATLLKGLSVVSDQLMAVLKSQQIDIISPQKGEPFDPTRHEALMQQPSDEYASPTVTMLLQKGYTLRERVLRPAQVAVSKSATE